MAITLDFVLFTIPDAQTRTQQTKKGVISLCPNKKICDTIKIGVKLLPLVANSHTVFVSWPLLSPRLFVDSWTEGLKNTETK